MFSFDVSEIPVCEKKDHETEAKSTLLKIQSRIRIELLAVTLSDKTIEIHLNFQDASGFAIKETVEFKQKKWKHKEGAVLFFHWKGILSNLNVIIPTTFSVYYSKKEFILRYLSRKKL